MTRLPAQLAHQSVAAQCPSGKIGGMTSFPSLDHLNPEQLRALAEPRLGLLVQYESRQGLQILRA